MKFTEEQIADFVRFMTKVRVGERRGDCWIWDGNKPGGRHGHFCMEGTTVKAHRWIYQFLREPIPDGLVVRHRCDNPQCVNPSHLETGTYADNTADMYMRGRAPNRKGSNHPLAVLSDEDVRAIRRMAGCGKPQWAIARQYGISRQQAGKIIRRESWGHVR